MAGVPSAARASDGAIHKPANKAIGGIFIVRISTPLRLQPPNAEQSTCKGRSESGLELRHSSAVNAAPLGQKCGHISAATHGVGRTPVAFCRSGRARRQAKMS